MPAHWQNALEWEIDYGLSNRIELAALLPIITIGYERRAAGTDSGIGDITFCLKYRFSHDRRP